MQFINANTSDMGSIMDILFENSRWLQELGINQWSNEKLVSQRREIGSSLQHGEFFKLVKEDNIYAVVQIKNQPESIWGFDPSHACYIHKLAIRRQYAKQGLGKQVLAAVEDMARSQGIHFLRLDCLAHNTKLRHYYEQAGYQYKGVANLNDETLALYERQKHH